VHCENYERSGKSLEGGKGQHQDNFMNGLLQRIFPTHLDTQKYTAPFLHLKKPSSYKNCFQKKKVFNMCTIHVQDKDFQMKRVKDLELVNMKGSVLCAHVTSKWH
jgi:hypothetical protein